ncbi:MAG: hypothetical protein Q9195_001730 [Heterodermia aff. obscurata]
MPSFTGRCHCGEVEWTVELPEESQAHVLCHCDACKLLSGGESTLNQIVPKDALKITKGTTKTYTYTGDSGTAPPFSQTNTTVMGDNIVVRTGLLQGTKGFKAAAEIYGKDRLGWQPEVAHTFEGPPPS